MSSVKAEQTKSILRGNTRGTLFSLAAFVIPRRLRLLKYYNGNTVIGLAVIPVAGKLGMRAKSLLRR